MADSPSRQDPSKPLSEYGRVAARVRSYPLQPDVDTKAPIGPIPARLRPETLRFLQSSEPAAKPKESPARRKVTNQLIPAIAEHKPRHPSLLALSDPPVKGAGKEKYPSNRGEKRNIVDSAAGGLELSSKQAMPSPKMPTNVVSHKKEQEAQERATKPKLDAECKELADGEQLSKTSPTIPVEHRSITAELQDMIDQSLNDTSNSCSKKTEVVDEHPRLQVKELRDLNSLHSELPSESSNGITAAEPIAAYEQGVTQNPKVAQSSPGGCNECPSDRFEIFLRERTRSSPCCEKPCQRNESTDPNSVADDELRSECHPPLCANAQQTQQPKSRYWRWWKLVLLEHESDGRDPSIAQEATDSTAAQGDFSETSVEHNGARKGSVPLSPREVANGNEVQTLNTRSDGVAEHRSPCPSIERIDLQPPCSFLQGHCVMQVKDKFGHGVLVDHEEIPVDALDSLCLLNTSDSAATHQRRRRGQRLRVAAQLEPSEPRSRLSIPKEAIAPITQNDGASSGYQHAQGGAVEAQEDAQNQLRGPPDPGSESMYKGISPAPRTQDSGEVASGVKANKIIVSIEDGGRKLVRIEILHGKATAVVRSETQD